MYFVLNLSKHAVPELVTDCKGILDCLRLAPHSLTSHDKALARTWGMVKDRLNDDLQQLEKRLTWMPSRVPHRAASRCRDVAGKPARRRPCEGSCWAASAPGLGPAARGACQAVGGSWSLTELPNLAW